MLVQVVLPGALLSQDAEDYYLYGQMLVRCCLDEAHGVGPTPLPELKNSARHVSCTEMHREQVLPI